MKFKEGDIIYAANNPSRFVEAGCIGIVEQVVYDLRVHWENEHSKNCYMSEHYNTWYVAASDVVKIGEL